MTEEETKSRSQIKREMSARQKMGEHLVQLSPAQLERLDLPSQLKEAVILAGRLSKHGAKRRQIQYIGALMRRLDPKPIQRALNRLDQGEKKEAWAFKETERLRNRLVGGDDELITELTRRFPCSDAQRLSQLVLSAREEARKGHPRKSSRALFRYLRSLLET